MLGRLEHHLLKNGFKVLSDNFIRGEVPAGSTIISTRDTTYRVPNSQSVACVLQKKARQITSSSIKVKVITAAIGSIHSLSILSIQKPDKMKHLYLSGEGKSGYNSIHVDEAIALFIAGLAGK